jgi:hypothetical protein
MHAGHSKADTIPQKGAPSIRGRVLPMLLCIMLTQTKLYMLYLHQATHMVRGHSHCQRLPCMALVPLALDRAAQLQLATRARGSRHCCCKVRCRGLV